MPFSNRSLSMTCAQRETVAELTFGHVGWFVLLRFQPLPFGYCAILATMAPFQLWGYMSICTRDEYISTSAHIPRTCARHSVDEVSMATNRIRQHTIVKNYNRTSRVFGRRNAVEVTRQTTKAHVLTTCHGLRGRRLLAQRKGGFHSRRACQEVQQVPATCAPCRHPWLNRPVFQAAWPRRKLRARDRGE